MVTAQYGWRKRDTLAVVNPVYPPRLVPSGPRKIRHSSICPKGENIIRTSFSPYFLDTMPIKSLRSSTAAEKTENDLRPKPSLHGCAIFAIMQFSLKRTPSHFLFFPTMLFCPPLMNNVRKLGHLLMTEIRSYQDLQLPRWSFSCNRGSPFVLSVSAGFI